MNTYLATPAQAQAGDHAEADLLDLLDRYAVHALADNHDALVPAAQTRLADELLAWRDGGAS